MHVKKFANGLENMELFLVVAFYFVEWSWSVGYIFCFRYNLEVEIVQNTKEKGTDISCKYDLVAAFKRAKSD